jgi:hypothetical protein
MRPGERVDPPPEILVFGSDAATGPLELRHIEIGGDGILVLDRNRLPPTLRLKLLMALPRKDAYVATTVLRDAEVPFVLVRCGFHGWETVAFRAHVERLADSGNVLAIFLGRDEAAGAPEWFRALREAFQGPRAREILRFIAGPTGRDGRWSVAPEPRSPRRWPVPALAALLLASVLTHLSSWWQPDAAGPLGTSAPRVTPSPPSRLPATAPSPTGRQRDGEPLANDPGARAVLDFPLRGDPYAAAIGAVFDHAMADHRGVYAVGACDGIVTAYTGEQGRAPAESASCTGIDAYPQRGSRRFLINGSYSGPPGGSAAKDPGYLGGDGHPGVDFLVAERTPLDAVATGTVRYPQRLVGPRDGTALRALELRPDDHPDLRVIYLHLATHPVLGEIDWQDDTPGCDPIERLPLPSGSRISRGCAIGLSGRGDQGPHLHLEVQRLVPLDRLEPQLWDALRCPDEPTNACVPVDPYGWDGEGPDPYAALTGVANARLWNHRPLLDAVEARSAGLSPPILELTGEGLASARPKIFLLPGSAEVSTARVRTKKATSQRLVLETDLMAGRYAVLVEDPKHRRSNWKSVQIGQ